MLDEWKTKYRPICRWMSFLNILDMIIFFLNHNIVFMMFISTNLHNVYTCSYLNYKTNWMVKISINMFFNTFNLQQEENICEFSWNSEACNCQENHNEMFTWMGRKVITCFQPWYSTFSDNLISTTWQKLQEVGCMV